LPRGAVVQWLIVPIAMEESFACREGGRTVGAGIVITIEK
jgi:translation elongation factor EF-Tu-like GTPase